ncbi:hypothetical protein J2TS6_54770 [Paenibacillus albilobatus]|uniref:Uncharacterized protein n=1 Tax=Paenibacillus albilobatus TaxID=2716884 RepID=A0A919XLD4_9BACL|nr:hypothetical protein [Paenibacillus albilobatus]GIO34336.1 hypothetical protein J2TS6_54770 [Paenibacillus albilobatus]
MKAVPKVNTDGLYIEDALVDDTFSGVVPFYADPPEPDPIESDASPEQPEDGEEPERVIAGYIVGVPVVPGLYLPRFDLAAWEAREEDKPVNPADFWREGLTPEEIEEMHKPAEPSELERLEKDMTSLKEGVADIASELDQVARKADDRLEDVGTIGSEQVKQDLATLDLKKQSTVIGGELVKKDIAILDLYQQNKALGQMLAALELKILAGGDGNVQ